MKQEFELWMKQAEDDLEKAEILFRNNKFDGTASNCQQAVEKSLKALVIKNKKVLIKTHSLIKLGSLVNLPNGLLIKIEKFESIYQGARYPDISMVSPYEKFEREDGLSFIETAKEVLEWVKKKLIL